MIVKIETNDGTKESFEANKISLKNGIVTLDCDNLIASIPTRNIKKYEVGEWIWVIVDLKTLQTI